MADDDSDSFDLNRVGKSVHWTRPGPLATEEPSSAPETGSTATAAAPTGHAGAEAASPEAASRSGGARADVDEEEIKRLGAHLASALHEGGYHPVILFGTNASGKTSLLLSLLSTLMSEPQLETGLALCDPILGTESRIGRGLHEEARQLFDVKTQAFIEGEKIPATRLPLPFFIPVEVRPSGKMPMRFAFLESNGEWYRPARKKGSVASGEKLYEPLREELEDFIASFQGAITFIYLTPYTQLEVYSDKETNADNEEVLNASLAISGVLRAYDRIRAVQRENDRHLMLVTKWDAHSARDVNRAEGIEEDRAALTDFCARKYNRALADFQLLKLAPEQRQLNAYCSGIINERGLLQQRHDDDVRDVIRRYPIRLWSWLYGNALQAANEPVTPLFPEPPKPPAILQAWRRLLDFVSGR